jgi:type VI secretion system protein ImpL
MNLIKILSKLETQLDTKLRNSDVVYNSIVPLGILCLIAEAVWLIGPYVIWKDQAILAQPEKRLYIILFVFLAWLLKFLIIDLNTSKSSLPHKDLNIRKKLQALQSRFLGAIKFLDTNSILKQNTAINLSELPWYLLIGPSHAGKTSLLAHADTHFILHKNFQPQDLPHLSPSEHCDWWVTRDASIIDVPGKYLSAYDGINPSTTKNTTHLAAWLFFLKLIKKHRRKKNINGIIIALPAPEIMKLTDQASYQNLLTDLIRRTQEIQQAFRHTIPCQLLITKCDLLPGFAEFFAESPQEETAQAWGVSLPSPKKGEKLADLFTTRFNLLIKNLNQQLLWRMHQERNPMARLNIKDFPLQIERLKEFTTVFIKKISGSSSGLALHGVYLTSAYQSKHIVEESILDPAINFSLHSMQIFKEPPPVSRAYFIKQFFTYGVNYPHSHYAAAFQIKRWKNRCAYLASATTIALAATLLGQDFQKAVQQTYALQKYISDYQSNLNKTQDSTIRLSDSIQLLSILQRETKNNYFHWNLSYFLSFYSTKSQQKANELYQASLRSVLLPEIKNYFEEYLATPINKNADEIYVSLKAYLMLGDASHFNAQYISDALQNILPKSLQENEENSLMEHLKLTLNSSWTPLALNSNAIQIARQYLAALPELKLSYVVLKNMENNNAASEINIEESAGIMPIFSSKEVNPPISNMFTAKSFNQIVSQEIPMAAQEALLGNWVLGSNIKTVQSTALAASLIEQLNNAYLSNYTEVWENFLANIRLAHPNDLSQTNAMITSIISHDSPFLRLLTTVHDNTNFQTIMVLSPKLQQFNLLIEKNNDSQKMLYDIFASLQSLHTYLQSILNAEDEKKAAFDAISSRMLSRGTPDAITQLRIISEKCPPPLKNWLAKITNDSWNYLMQEAGQYLDVSWQNQVLPYYQTDIADRYPFTAKSEQEVSLQKFAQFFGNPGVIMNFYNANLQQFVDASTKDWHWKNIDGQALPFSAETLRQLQLAFNINHTFFPNGDNTFYVKFALQPYEFGKFVKAVQLTINDRPIVDENDSKNTHSIVWQNNNAKMTAIQFMLANQQTIDRYYPGNWGWYKLVNQSFESMLSKKEILINLSLNENAAKYILSTESKNNPFLSLNLQHFHLPQQLIEQA